MDRAEVSVIIPANNEVQTIGELINKTKALYPDFHDGPHFRTDLPDAF